MQETGIPTGRAEIFRDAAAAAAYVESLDDLPVIKASGLAAGKGVILPESKAEALAALRAILVERQFGEAGDAVLIEERLSGRRCLCWPLRRRVGASCRRRRTTNA